MLGTMSLILSVLLFTTTLSEAQILMWGPCPVLKSYAPKLDVQSFTGTWYEMIRTKRWVGTEIECVTHDLEMSTRHNISYLTNSYSSTLDKEFAEEGDALVNHGPTNGGQKDAVVFYIEEYGTMNELVLLDTDYTSFAVLWSCAATDEDLHFENTMIWARDRVPKAAALSRGLRTLDVNNLTRNYLTYTRHRNCPDFHRNAMQGVGKETSATMAQSNTMDESTITPMMSSVNTKTVANSSPVSMSSVSMPPAATKVDSMMMPSSAMKIESSKPTSAHSNVAVTAGSPPAAAATEKAKIASYAVEALKNSTYIPNHINH